MNLEDFLSYWNRERLEELVEKVWTSKENSDNAKKVIMGESSWQIFAFNKYTHPYTWRTYRVRGLLQISDIHKGGLESYPSMLDDQLVFDPVRNLTIAKELWIREDRKWSPTWSAATKLGIE